jgi:nucleoside-diphosphate-sugar epimerase
MARYTVIGASGFIGSRLCARLKAEGHEVYAPARDDPDVFQRDLHRVFDCAGLTGDYRQRPFDAVEAHVGLLARLLEHARFERLVYLSSTRLYDATDGGQGREDRSLSLNPNDPRCVYELSKAMGENLTVTQSQGRGVAARLSYVFDWEAGAEGFLSDWLRAARDRRTLEIDSSPDAGRDYIHVDDVIHALRAILDSDQGGIVNVASGETLANRDVAEVFARRGWTVRFTRPSEPIRPTAIDISRLESLGVRPQRTSEVIDGYLAGLPRPR